MICVLGWLMCLYSESPGVQRCVNPLASPWRQTSAEMCALRGPDPPKKVDLPLKLESLPNSLHILSLHINVCACVCSSSHYTVREKSEEVQWHRRRHFGEVVQQHRCSWPPPLRHDRFTRLLLFLSPHTTNSSHAPLVSTQSSLSNTKTMIND